MDSGTSYKAQIDFDGGLLCPTNTSSEHTGSWIEIMPLHGCFVNVKANIREGGFWFEPRARGHWNFSAFGAVPETPTNNIFILGRKNENWQNQYVLHFGDSFDVAPTRGIYIGTNALANIGANNGKTARIRGRIFGETSSVFRVVSNWNGQTILDPGNDVTNHVGQFAVHGKLALASGVTVVGMNTGTKAEGKQASFYVHSNTTSFSPDTGCLTICGGEICTPFDNYLTLLSYAQVVITNGHLNAVESREYLNGLDSPARTFVADRGVLTTKQLRITQASTRDANGDPMTGVTVATGGVIRATQVRIDSSQSTRVGYFAFDGDAASALPTRICWTARPSAKRRPSRRSRRRSRRCPMCLLLPPMARSWARGMGGVDGPCSFRVTASRCPSASCAARLFCLGRLEMPTARTRPVR